MTTSDEELIRTMIERWAEAVHRGDLEAVVAGHAEDIVMFDVPPPYEGVRGLEEYAKTWPPFFRWQAQGARFEIESLDVTAGEDVAFAHALLRCGTEEDFARDPRNRLRLTIGLRKQDGRWVVAHEHHSFPYVQPHETEAEEEIRAVHRRWYDGTAAKDLDGMMAAIADDVVSYEHEAPLRYVGVDAVREVCARALAEAGDAAVTLDVPDLAVVAQGDLAVAWGLNRVRVERPDGGAEETWSRGTRVFRRGNGRWLMVHQHLSVPLDLETGMARTDLRP
ncbi:uncharacterized protein (TIGR02246 family) [Thermocatellispora tengchongensis]|uniref:Uncharacterized protein (TIGR02246 family) n=1 Tax=Thermocatellispora tengchongensis TaxID=1073253 RepID=A0A840PAQ3_9ACTN|nr:SgcJ/EcaC family oxidoreductase [Thermocatellispora tengchongensis]MBB5134941.1 uncharacterized protein (TIGR02246 family) [Thermocatellispora tengchongensis]